MKVDFLSSGLIVLSFTILKYKSAIACKSFVLFTKFCIPNLIKFETEIFKLLKLVSSVVFKPTSKFSILFGKNNITSKIIIKIIFKSIYYIL